MTKTLINVSYVRFTHTLPVVQIRAQLVLMTVLALVEPLPLLSADAQPTSMQPTEPML